MNQYLDPVTQDTLEALVDAIIPRSPVLAEEYGRIQFYGAQDQATEEYLILNLSPYAAQTAELLNTAAGQLYSLISPGDRLLIIDRLRQGQMNTSELPPPFRNNPESVMTAAKSLPAAAMMGYYSEWYGYGTTRLEAPNNRRLEYYPISWEQTGYPGPSLGYRALREYRLS
jgi:hypothetical protein